MWTHGAAPDGPIELHTSALIVLTTATTGSAGHSGQIGSH
jgi:hypothetical protein